MDRITIIGSGSIGLSMGLGIKAVGLKETELVGTSGDRKWREKANETGAFDSVGGHLGRALDGARLVILDVPATETKDMMEAIGPVLEQDCRVTNTGLSMAQALDLADAYFREDTTFVAGRPMVRTPSADLDAADGAVFHGADYCLAPSPTARPDAIKTVVGLVEALGAVPAVPRSPRARLLHRCRDAHAVPAFVGPDEHGVGESVMAGDVEAGRQRVR